MTDLTIAPANVHPTPAADRLADELLTTARPLLPLLEEARSVLAVDDPAEALGVDRLRSVCVALGQAVETLPTIEDVTGFLDCTGLLAATTLEEPATAPEALAGADGYRRLAAAFRAAAEDLAPHIERAARLLGRWEDAHQRVANPQAEDDLYACRRVIGVDGLAIEILNLAETLRAVPLVNDVTPANPAELGDGDGVCVRCGASLARYRHGSESGVTCTACDDV